MKKNNQKSTTGLEKLSCKDSEVTVVGCCLIEKDAIIQVRHLLKKNSFFFEDIGLVFEAICELYDNGDVVNTITVCNRMRKNNTLEKIGGAAFIAFLTESVASGVPLKNHALIILEFAMRRRIYLEGARMMANSQDLSQDAFDVSLEAQEKVLEAAGLTNIGNSESLSDYGPKYKKEKEEGKKDFIPTLFPSLDKFIEGYRPGQLIVVGGRPSMGKSAYLLSLATKINIEGDVPVAFFTLEMTKKQVYSRMLANLSNVPTSVLKDPEKYKLARHRVERGYELTFPKKNFIINDLAGISIAQLQLECRKLHVKHGIKVVFVDYIQLVESGCPPTTLREQQVAKIAKGLKKIAKDLAITVIFGAQLNRSVEIRGGDRRPELQDIRESGSISQDADMVKFLYRKKYYDKDDKNNKDKTEDFRRLLSESGETLTEDGDKAEIIIAKQRDGATGTFTLNFEGEYTRFVEEEAPSKYKKLTF